MKIYSKGLLVIIAIASMATLSARPIARSGGGVAAAPAAKKPAIPVIGINYTLGQLWGLININNPMKTSTFILPALGGKVLTHEQCWPSQGKYLDGSISADRVNFGGIVINQAWIAENQNMQVQLQADPLLTAYLARTKRLTRAAALDQQYGQILLYFVLQIGAANYRFYLVDPFPGRIQGNNFPARAIMSKWDYQRAFRP